MATANLPRLRGKAIRVLLFAALAIFGLHLLWYTDRLGPYGRALPYRPGSVIGSEHPEQYHHVIDHETAVTLGHEVDKAPGDHSPAQHADNHDASRPEGTFYSPEEAPQGDALSNGSASPVSIAPKLTTGTTDISDKLLPCYEADGMRDIVYVIKTGSTEAMERLPVHFNTTMKCFPNVLIFSDYGETMDRHVIHDALDNVIEDIRLVEQDFELWRRLKEKGRADLRPEELSDHNHVADPNSGGGQPENGGWRLDKFKNVPMVGKTLALHPNAKWYLFTDADTFISWSNLARWTKMLDHDKPLYIGSPAVISDQLFAHGGSGYLLSRPAMRKVADFYHDNQEELDRFAAEHWAGDCVLSSTLEHKLDVGLTWAFPILQGGDPTLQDFSEYGYDRQIWCYPTVSYHHLTPAAIQSLWEFEQQWTSDTNTRDEPIRHKNIFKQWAMPQMVNEREDWENMSFEEVDEHIANDINSCRAHCERNSSCLQYSYRDDACRTAAGYPKLGNAASPGHRSGWMTSRIGDFASDLDGKCDSQGDWITS
nr:hypothetical protein CFP56_32481 [Quercus suber]